MNIGDLRQRQSLPLEMKIQKSIRTIEQWYEMHEGDVYISRGGVDSTVLSWLAKQSIYADKIEEVSVAGVEPVENIMLNKKQGVTLLKTSVNKKDIIEDWGYPLISKQVSMSISRYARTKHEWVKDRRLNGYMGRNGKMVMDGSIPKKYKELIYAPFELTEKCCDKFKKSPLKLYEKESKKYPITGEMASESRLRQNEYLKHGCIMNDKGRPKCTPLGFWTTEDIKECIYRYNIEIPKIYGEVIKTEEDKYEFTGEKRTGWFTAV